MRPLKASFLALSLSASLFVFAGCSSDDAGGDAVAFQAEAEPLGGFAYDTGLVPAASPVQVSLSLSAGGKVRVEASGEASKTGLKGKPGSGKVALDVHVKMDGRIKVTSALKNVDEDLPGLKDIDVPIVGEAKFDPFVVEEGQSAKVDVAIPETQLPEVPLGAIPGKLQLTIAAGSTLTTEFEGGCVRVVGGKASYTGATHTSGKLVLKGTIVSELPAPLNKSFDLGDIEVAVPNVDAALAFADQDAKGAGDGQAGRTCPPPGTDLDADGDVSGGGDGGASQASDESFEITVESQKVVFDGPKAAVLDRRISPPAVSVSARNAANDKSIEIQFSGAPGTYDCANGAWVAYRPRAGAYTAPNGDGAACTVTVSEVGNVGAYVEGTVTAIVRGPAGVSPSVLSLTGSFRVKRDADRQ